MIEGIREAELLSADWHEEQGNWDVAQHIRSQPWEVGRAYYFRLATYAWCGVVVSVGEREIILEQASYVADSGRFHNAMTSGLESQSSEIEPVSGRVIIGRGALVDCCEYNHKTPTVQK